MAMASPPSSGPPRSSSPSTPAGGRSRPPGRRAWPFSTSPTIAPRAVLRLGEVYMHGREPSRQDWENGFAVNAALQIGHLAGRGRVRIAMALPDHDFPLAEARLGFAQEAARRRGLPPLERLVVPRPREAGAAPVTASTRPSTAPWPPPPSPPSTSTPRSSDGSPPATPWASTPEAWRPRPAASRYARIRQESDALAVDDRALHARLAWITEWCGVSGPCVPGPPRGLPRSCGPRRLCGTPSRGGPDGCRGRGKGRFRCPSTRSAGASPR